MSIPKIGIFDLASYNRKNSMLKLHDMFEYAQRADALGFSRYWISEHHRSDSTHPYNNPEIVISLIAGMTENIRVGSAGSLVGYYLPYSLAQNYKLLNNLYNDRIDFGLSKGRPSHSHKHNYFKAEGTMKNGNFMKHVEEICQLYHNEDLNFSNHDIVLPPFKGTTPSLWYLTNSYRHNDFLLDKELFICRSLMHGLDILEVPPEKEELLRYKTEFHRIHGYKPPAIGALAVCFDKTKFEKLKENEFQENRREALKILPVTRENFKEIILEFQDKYGFDEFVIYDDEPNIEKKVENLECMKECILQTSTVES